jgi:hypothetical protein
VKQSGVVTMARPRGRPPKAEQSEFSSVKIERGLAVRAKRLAELRGRTVPEVLSELLRAPLARAWVDAMREEERAAKG